MSEKIIKAALTSPWRVIDNAVREAVEYGWHRKAYKHVDPPPLTKSQLEYLFDALAESVSDSLRDTLELDGEL